MTAGDGERIVHLYRWDSYDDAKQRLAAIVTPERMEYFVTARSFLLRQENSYLDHAPVAELSPLWNDKRDWLPNQPAFTNVGNASELAVSERVLDFLPGGLLAYWEGFRKLNASTVDAFRDRLVGVFFVTVGSLHRVFRLPLAQELDRGGGASPSACRNPRMERLLWTTIVRGLSADMSPIFGRAPCPGCAHCLTPSIGR